MGNKHTEEDIIREANIMIEGDLTIRKAETILGIPRSTLHYHMTTNLPNIDKNLYYKISLMFNRHKKMAAVNGGLARSKKIRA